MQYIAYQNASGSVSIVIPTGELPIEEVFKLVVPAGVPYKYLDSLPENRLLRDAWKLEESGITVDLEASKLIAHDIRRQLREREFEPLDMLISKQIPGTDLAAIEAQRQQLRTKYSEVQLDIDAAADTGSLERILEGLL